jgi:phytoene synthase
VTEVASQSAAGGDRVASLVASNAYCLEVTRSQAKNFYYGMKVVPEPKRSAMYALYAWMREADDLADAEGSAEEKTERLDVFREQTNLALAGELGAETELPEGPFWRAFREMALRYELPREYLDAMIAGQLLDQEVTRYKTFDELYDYCYKVASVVGLSCIQIWGYDGSAEARQLSEWRGIAFQLTNILRDVLEDAGRDRVYVPAEDFGVFSVSPTMFTMNKSEDVIAGIARVAERARVYYERSAPLDERVHPDGRPCLWAMTKIYRGLLDRIVKDPAVVLSGKRVSMGKAHKAWIALTAPLHRGRARGGGK